MTKTTKITKTLTAPLFYRRKGKPGIAERCWVYLASHKRPITGPELTEKLGLKRKKLVHVQVVLSTMKRRGYLEHTHGAGYSVVR